MNGFFCNRFWAKAFRTKKIMYGPRRVRAREDHTPKTQNGRPAVTRVVGTHLVIKRQNSKGSPFSATQPQTRERNAHGSPTRSELKPRLQRWSEMCSEKRMPRGLLRTSIGVPLHGDMPASSNVRVHQSGSGRPRFIPQEGERRETWRPQNFILTQISTREAGRIAWTSVW